MHAPTHTHHNNTHTTPPHTPAPIVLEEGRRDKTKTEKHKSTAKQQRTILLARTPDLAKNKNAAARNRGLILADIFNPLHNTTSVTLGFFL
jgi:hypothetical protein